MPRPERPAAARKIPRLCPWQNYPTHKRNRQLEVHGDLPLSYGYCPQELECSSCAGTLYKPNIALEAGRPTVFIECPHCDPEGFRRRVERLKSKLPKGAGPTSTPLSEERERQAAAQGDVRGDGFERPRR
jgi:hypothetical protein